MRKPHGIKPQDRTYTARPCAVCHTVFVPHHPRARRCDECRKVQCVACGADISGSAKLNRILGGQAKVCASCRGCPDGSRRVEKASGYVSIKVNGQWRYEHRVVMERIIGRPLQSREVVHHRDKNPSNNEPDNLQLFPNMRVHLEQAHADDLKNPPVHHNGRKPKNNSERQAAAEGNGD